MADPYSPQLPSYVASVPADDDELVALSGDIDAQLNHVLQEHRGEAAPAAGARAPGAGCAVEEGATANDAQVAHMAAELLFRYDLSEFFAAWSVQKRPRLVDQAHRLYKARQYEYALVILRILWSRDELTVSTCDILATILYFGLAGERVGAASPSDDGVTKGPTPRKTGLRLFEQSLEWEELAVVRKRGEEGEDAVRREYEIDYFQLSRRADALYTSGRYEEATRVLIVLKAHDRLDANTACLYAQLHYYGHFLPCNKEIALEYFLKASDMGSATGLFFGALMLYRGEGTPGSEPDLEAARARFERVAFDNPGALLAQAERLIVKKQSERARAFLEMLERHEREHGRHFDGSHNDVREVDDITAEQRAKLIEKDEQLAEALMVLAHYSDPPDSALVSRAITLGWAPHPHVARQHLGPGSFRFRVPFDETKEEAVPALGVRHCGHLGSFCRQTVPQSLAFFDDWALHSSQQELSNTQLIFLIRALDLGKDVGVAPQHHRVFELLEILIPRLKSPRARGVALFRAGQLAPSEAQKVKLWQRASELGNGDAAVALYKLEAFCKCTIL